MVTEPRHDDLTSPVLMLLHQHPQTAELTSRCYFARAVSKRDRQSGENIPCERGFADHASASATLPALHPMSTSGGSAGTSALEIGSTVFLMGFFNTIPGSEKPIGILSWYLLIAVVSDFFHRFAAMIRSWLRREMNMRSALIRSKQCWRSLQGERGIE
jgi:hypothetical protein